MQFGNWNHIFYSLDRSNVKRKTLHVVESCLEIIKKRKCMVVSNIIENEITWQKQCKKKLKTLPAVES